LILVVGLTTFGSWAGSAGVVICLKSDGYFAIENDCSAGRCVEVSQNVAGDESVSFGRMNLIADACADYDLSHVDFASLSSARHQAHTLLPLCEIQWIWQRWVVDAHQKSCQEVKIDLPSIDDPPQILIDSVVLVV